MDPAPKIAHVAALVGDPARANILAALMSGQALTASELAHHAHVTPQTASGHLAKLTDAALLALERQGRHRYYRLASPLVSQMLESIMLLAPDGPARPATPWRHGEALRTARTCYDHLAGRIAVAITTSLTTHGHLLLDADGGQLTKSGQALLACHAIHLPTPTTTRPFCRPCLDWSERRPHLAGRLGAALLTHALAQRWLTPQPGTRALTLNPSGHDALSTIFGVTV